MPIPDAVPRRPAADGPDRPAGPNLPSPILCATFPRLASQLLDPLLRQAAQPHVLSPCASFLAPRPRRRAGRTVRPHAIPCWHRRGRGWPGEGGARLRRQLGPVRGVRGAVHHGDEWGSDGERSDDETVDEVNGRIGQYRRLTPDLNNGDGDVENSPTTISPTPLDDATHALFTNGLGKDYGTLSKRPRRARRASSTTTTTTTATTVPVQTLTSSPHTNYIAKLRRLFPFMWPRNDRRLQLLIVLCLLLLVAERVVNVLLPISYKNVVDALAKEGGGGRVVWKEILIFVGLRMLQGGVGFIGTAQKGLWVPIGQFTTRELQVRMFEHLLNLSLRFHLNRKTGEILRVQGTPMFYSRAPTYPTSFNQPSTHAFLLLTFGPLHRPRRNKYRDASDNDLLQYPADADGRDGSVRVLHVGFRRVVRRDRVNDHGRVRWIYNAIDRMEDAVSQGD
ncbi:hypothetical protein BC936DRAFT_139381 [Jimgerdemannia flammicorona]|uniref:ABC transmembrane type-1 domain-containing protein n=1 Tax=Jimgerdemannia flammicorona TaxID=994334 RepID=A0A433BA04_9FUNG|nr:hypothetical protein BC936DRAFT_139381 [Jimgerdemannia flammicorona]